MTADVAAPVKRCPACDQTKPIEAFSRDRTKADGRTWRCRDCAKAAWQAKHPPKPKPACANCQARWHGRWCANALFGPPCPCPCCAVLGLNGPFELSDPTAPDGADVGEVA